MIPLRDHIRSRSFPILNLLFVAANAGVFYLELQKGTPQALQAFVHRWAVVPSLLMADPVAHGFTLLTAMFFHGGWTHFLGNMIFLLIFGDNVEDRLGHGRYFLFYLATGAAANYFQAYVSAASSVPLIGASGAIAGVLGAYFFFYPKAVITALIPIGIFITIRQVPAFLLLGVWFLMQAFSGTLSIAAAMNTVESTGGVAWWAHASGFVFGGILGPLMAKRRTR